MHFFMTSKLFYLLKLLLCVMGCSSFFIFSLFTFRVHKILWTWFRARIQTVQCIASSRLSLRFVFFLLFLAIPHHIVLYNPISILLLLSLLPCKPRGWLMIFFFYVIFSEGRVSCMSKGRDTGHVDKVVGPCCWFRYAHIDIPPWLESGFKREGRKYEGGSTVRMSE